MTTAKLGLILFASLLVTSGSSNLNTKLSKGANDGSCPLHMKTDQCPMHKNGENCPMHANSDFRTTAATVQQKKSEKERPDGSWDTETHRWSAGDGCSSVNPDAEPDTKLNGVVENTVGCGCEPKCSDNGQRVEDRRKENGVYICKNACNEDRCHCPDPCKS